MASPTTASKGMWIAVTILGILCLGLIILSVTSIAQVQRLDNELTIAESDLEAAIRPTERGDRWEELKIASGSGRGVVTYLDNQLQQAMNAVTGVRRDTVEDLAEQIQSEYGENAPPLMDVLSQREARIDALETQLARVEQQREEAIAERDRSRERIARLQQDYRESIDRAEGEVGEYSSLVQGYRRDVEQTKDDLNDRVSSIRNDADARISSLESEIDQLSSENLILQDQIARLRGARADETLSPRDEFALVDGRVVGINPANNQVFISRGRKDQLVQGLTFEVYPAGTVIRPDEEGEYPRGKATIEVVRIEENSAVAYILRETAGNPILRNDLIANAVYDPEKKYSFTVFGNFDIDDDGIATPEERLEVEALIKEWGGSVSNDIAGDTDFVILGRKPIVPPQPDSESPPEVLKRFIEIRRTVDKYEEIFNTASQTGIPVLNQNRLRTLTGMGERR